MAQMHQAVAARRVTGAELSQSLWPAMLTEAYGSMGQAAEGLALVAEALVAVEKTQERFNEAELYRLKGELLLAQAVTRPLWGEVEACFHQALDVARRQQAKSWELRAATSLCRLWRQQGKRAEAYELLAPIYGWFTEGFDTVDLQEAKVLLDELEG